MEFQLILQAYSNYINNIDLRKIIYIYISLVIHELGHIVVALMMRLKIIKIGITIFGFNMQVRTNDVSFNKKIALFYAGPIVNFILGTILLFANKYNFSMSNFILGFINMIPIVPLDGGNAFKEIMTILFRKERIYIISIFINIIFLVMSIMCYFVMSSNYIYVGFMYISVKGILLEREFLLEEKIKNSYKELLKKTYERNGGKL